MQFLSFLNDFYYYSLILYILGTVSLPIHIFGAYCILFKTPEIMKRVKWVMFNLHFWSCSLDILLGILGQPFVIPPVFGGTPLGLLHFFGASPGIMVYLMVTIMEFVSLSIITIFENRFFILFAEKTWWRYGRYPLHIINHLLGILYFVPTMMGVPDQQQAREWVFKTYPQLRQFNSTDHPIYVITFDPKARQNIDNRMIVASVIQGIEMWTFFFLLRYKMKKTGREMTMSKKTFEAHTAFLRATYMQIAIPVALISTPLVSMMVFGFLGVSTPEMNSISYMTMSIHGACGSIVMLYYHAPYR